MQLNSRFAIKMTRLCKKYVTESSFDIRKGFWWEASNSLEHPHIRIPLACSHPTL